MSAETEKYKAHTEWGRTVLGRIGAKSLALFTPEDAAAVLGVSKTKVLEDIHAGWLPAANLGRSRHRACWRVAAADIVEYVKRCEWRV